jgi:cell division control protein 6
MAVETQPKQFQLTFLAIIRLLKKMKRENNEDKIFTGDIFNLYSELCRKTKTEILTQRRISDIIAEFDMLGLINATVISKGRYGRTREIRIDLPEQLVEKMDSLLLNSLGL